MSDGDIGGPMEPLPGEAPELGVWTGDLLYLPAATGRSGMVGAVARHWDLIRGDRPFPRRNEIDPVAIWHCLPYLAIADYKMNPFRIHMGLVGSEVARQCPGLAGGRYLDQMTLSVQDFVQRTVFYSRLFAQKKPLFGFARTRYEDKEGCQFEWAVLPLSSDGVEVTGALSVEDYTPFTGPRVMAL